MSPAGAGDPRRAPRPEEAAPGTAPRVLHVVPGYPSPGNPHSHVFVATQVESLRALGLRCDVLVPGDGAIGRLARGGRAVRRTLDAAAPGDRFDLIHAHHSWSARAAAGHGIPVVLSFLGSDLWAFPWNRDGHGPISRRVNLAIARRGADRAAAVIVKAEWMRRALGRDAHVIPNGVDLRRFRPAGDDERAALRGELGWRADARVLVFGADPARPRKRFALAEAAAADAARRLDAPLELRPVHGLRHDEVARRLRAADLLLFTSDIEGSPNIVKEAMACGLAVVSVDVGDTRERLDGVPGCRLAADTPEALGSAVAELLRADEPRGGRQAVAELSLERVAGRVLAVYRSVIAPDGGAPSAGADPATGPEARSGTP